ncbi:hypothetical protein Q7C36_018358 [Tachysurus vachellii]|uniref:Stanniocalcin n=2 Tax=Tachysurus vachellii TaxID=175792 RepID=A0AA88M0Z3_TACVA|nr:hypothetical protein Q7C36_018358 [Tachysurus vachellii]
MHVNLAVVVLVLIVQRKVDTADSADVYNTSSKERPLNAHKRRLSLEDAVEIQQCLLSAGDVGCGTFECFTNNSCEIRGLHDICMSFLHNAGKFDSQGKSFIKDALKCMAHGFRHKFSCVSRKCVSVKEMVFQLQRECYNKHNLCSVVRENTNVMMEMIHFQDLFPRGPHVELVNILLGCGEEVRVAITHRIHAQCEQNWGALCASLSLCLPDHSSIQTAPTVTPVPAISSSNFLPRAKSPLSQHDVQQI